MIEKIEKAAYEIVCKMIDFGYVESEPEGLDWEHEIAEIIKKHLNNKTEQQDMEKYDVTLFILGLPYNPNNTRVVTIEANSQDEAEQKAHDWYVEDGWGVYDSVKVN